MAATLRRRVSDRGQFIPIDNFMSWPSIGADDPIDFDKPIRLEDDDWDDYDDDYSDDDEDEDWYDDEDDYEDEYYPDDDEDDDDWDDDDYYDDED